jgi:hypothetical protein
MFISQTHAAAHQSMNKNVQRRRSTPTSKASAERNKRSYVTCVDCWVADTQDLGYAPRSTNSVSIVKTPKACHYLQIEIAKDCVRR